MWREFGLSALLPSAALVLAVLYCMLSTAESRMMTAVLAVGFTFSFCVGFFNKLENSQSIFDILLRPGECPGPAHSDLGRDVQAVSPQPYGPPAGPLLKKALVELYRLLVEKQREDPRYEDLAAEVYNMAEGADAFIWNGYSDVSMDNDFICLDTRRLE